MFEGHEMDKTKHFWLEDLFRPIFELKASALWFLGAISLLIFSGIELSFKQSEASLYVASGMLIMALIRLREGYPLFKRQMKLFTNYLLVIDIAMHRKKHLKKKNKIISLGMGYEWGVEHAQRSAKIMSMSTDFAEVNQPLLLQPYIRSKQKVTETLGGKAWIQGLGDEAPIEIPASTMFGHTTILGVPGSGKTTLLTLLSTMSLYHGNTVIIIDPKNDPAWQNAMESEAKALGVPFHFFHPAHPSKSVCIDPLRNYSRSVELASRIAGLLPGSEKDADPFSQFAWKCINQIVDGLIYIGKRPQLVNIGFYLNVAKGKLAFECLDKLFKEVVAEDWQIQKTKQLTKLGGGSLLQGMIIYYQQELVGEHNVPAIDGVVTLVTHDAQHMSRMLASTDPLFAQLNSYPLNELLSPKLDLEADDDEAKKIIDIDKFTETGGVLYIALDSNSSSVTSSAMSKLILGSLSASSARRYNYKEGKGRRLSIYCDESHSCVSPALVDLLATARGSAFELVISSQSIPDYIAKTSDAIANRILGLTSNFICLRCTDDITKQYASNNFGQAHLKSVSYRLSSDSDSSKSVGEHSSGVGETLNSIKDSVFDPQLLADLPNLQYIARLQNGKKIKGRIPLLKVG